MRDRRPLYRAPIKNFRLLRKKNKEKFSLFVFLLNFAAVINIKSLDFLLLSVLEIRDLKNKKINVFQRDIQLNN
jgi:hypothetical protein